MIKKYFVWLVIFILICVFVSSTDISVILKDGDSVDIKDKNVSLVDSLSDRVLVCVNGEKKIIEEGLDKRVNDVLIEISRTSVGEARLRLSYSCRNCICSDCSNEICFVECRSDSECDDKNEDTLDFCEEKKCFHKASSEKGGFVLLNDCLKDDECSDSSSGTDDFCFDGRCFHSNKVEVEEKSTYNFLALVFILLLIIVSLVVIYFKMRKKRY